MVLGITGKRIIVTGGAQGLAEATIRTLVSEGAHVIFFVLRDDAGAEVAKSATAAGPGTANWLHVDVSKRQEVLQGVDNAVRKLGGLDSVFCFAGVERAGLPEDITEEELDLVLNVNVKGTIFTNQAAFPHLKEGGGGSIVNFGSDAGLHPFPKAVHYAASKGAVHSFTRSLAAAWGKWNIRANSVAPAIWSPMYDAYRARLGEEELKAHDRDVGGRIVLGGKLGDPTEDLAPVMVFLASDASKFITGQIICVNGGGGQVR